MFNFLESFFELLLEACMPWTIVQIKNKIFNPFEETLHSRVKESREEGGLSFFFETFRERIAGRDVFGRINNRCRYSVILAKLVAELLKSRLINSRLNLEIGEIAWRYFLVDHVTWRPRNIDWQVHLWDFLAREIVCASRKRNENCDEKKREGGRDRFEILLCELARNISFWRNKIWKSNFFP